MGQRARTRVEGVGGGRRQPSLAALGDGAVTVRIERGTRTIRKHIYDIFWKLKFDDDGLHHQDAAVSRIDKSAVRYSRNIGRKDWPPLSVLLTFCQRLSDFADVVNEELRHRADGSILQGNDPDGAGANGKFHRQSL